MHFNILTAVAFLSLAGTSMADCTMYANLYCENQGGAHPMATPYRVIIAAS